MGRVREVGEFSSIKLFFVLCLGLLVSACAVGQKKDYRNQAIDINATSTQTIGVAVLDQRTYVVSGDKTPDFVGLRRGGYNNPFDVLTESGESLADDVAFSIVTSLSAQNINASILRTTPNSNRSSAKEALPRLDSTRVLMVYLTEWKSDNGYSLRILYDLSAEVLDENGNVLASSEVADTRASGPDFGGDTIPPVFQGALKELINDPNVLEALK